MSESSKSTNTPTSPKIEVVTQAELITPEEPTEFFELVPFQELKPDLQTGDRAIIDTSLELVEFVASDNERFDGLWEETLQWAYNLQAMLTEKHIATIRACCSTRVDWSQMPFAALSRSLDQTQALQTPTNIQDLHRTADALTILPHVESSSLDQNQALQTRATIHERTIDTDITTIQPLNPNIRHGVTFYQDLNNPSSNIIVRPNTGEGRFEISRELVDLAQQLSPDRNVSFSREPVLREAQAVIEALTNRRLSDQELTANGHLILQPLSREDVLKEAVRWCNTKRFTEEGYVALLSRAAGVVGGGFLGAIGAIRMLDSFNKLASGNIAESGAAGTSVVAAEAANHLVPNSSPTLLARIRIPGNWARRLKPARRIPNILRNYQYLRQPNQIQSNPDWWSQIKGTRSGKEVAKIIGTITALGSSAGYAFAEGFELLTKQLNLKTLTDGVASKLWERKHKNDGPFDPNNLTVEQVKLYVEHRGSLGIVDLIFNRQELDFMSKVVSFPPKSLEQREFLEDALHSQKHINGIINYLHQRSKR